MPTPNELEQYLVCNFPDKEWVGQKVIQILVSDGAIPAFSSSAIKLGELTRDQDISMDDIKNVIEMDPGLSSDCIKVASSAGFGARRISSIQQALMIIGMEQIKRIAFAMGVMKSFNSFKGKVDWDKFWLHSVLVGRLTEKVAEAYRPTTGREYLAGLLHDCGKILLEQYFPEEFYRIITAAQRRRCSHSVVEKGIIGVNHAQLGAAVCASLQAHPEVIQAVLHHHGPFGGSEGKPDDKKFLAACVSVGDALANYAQANITGARVINPDTPIDQLSEWRFLRQYRMAYGLELDLAVEVAATEQDLKAVSA